MGKIVTQGFLTNCFAVNAQMVKDLKLGYRGILY